MCFKIDSLAKWLKKTNESTKYLDLIVSFENDDEEEVNGPIVRFHYTGEKKRKSDSGDSIETPLAKQHKSES